MKRMFRPGSTVKTTERLRFHSVSGILPGGMELEVICSPISNNIYVPKGELYIATNINGIDNHRDEVHILRLYSREYVQDFAILSRNLTKKEAL